eukprot:6188803-Pleurochrysis_carterae.AAC.3
MSASARPTASTLLLRLGASAVCMRPSLSPCYPPLAPSPARSLAPSVPPLAPARRNRTGRCARRHATAASCASRPPNGRRR